MLRPEERKIPEATAARPLLQGVGRHSRGALSPSRVGRQLPIPAAPSSFTAAQDLPRQVAPQQ